MHETKTEPELKRELETWLKKLDAVFFEVGVHKQRDVNRAEVAFVRDQLDGIRMLIVSGQYAEALPAMILYVGIMIGARAIPLAEAPQLVELPKEKKRR